MSNNNIYEHSNTKAFYNMAWGSFIISFVGVLAGVFIMEAPLATKGFFVMSYLFSISSCFTVAKVVRDKQESGKIISKIEQAKAEKLINEYVTQ